MNIDEQIKTLEADREDLQIELKLIKTKINAKASQIRQLETVKRHAEKILNGANVTISASEEAPFKDPAQLDIEDDDIFMLNTKDSLLEAEVIQPAPEPSKEVGDDFMKDY